MDKAAASFRRKLGLTAFAVAVCFALMGTLLPGLNLRSFLWGAAIGLLPFSFFAINRKAPPSTPEHVRQKLNANRNWTKWVTYCAVGLGPLVGWALERFAAAHIIWLAGGFALGFFLMPMFFLAQAVLQPSKPKPRERQFPLEPKP